MYPGQGHSAGNSIKARTTQHTARHRTHTGMCLLLAPHLPDRLRSTDQHTHIWETAHKKRHPSVCTARIRKADIKKFIHILSVNMYCLSGSVYTSKGVCSKTSESNLTKFTHRTVQTHKAIRSRCRNTRCVPHTPHPGSPGLDSRR